ncbi:subunit 2 of RNA polymerase II transcription factor B [Chloropicon primus]|nr:subunit 2 of RNA polymerase II transcription factor B [Chloropicon primus]
MTLDPSSSSLSSSSSFISSHLLKLPAVTRDRVLDSEGSCQVILQTLPPLAKQYCLRICFSGEASEAMLDGWIAPESKDGLKRHKVAVETLLALGIWKKVDEEPPHQHTQSNKFRKTTAKSNAVRQATYKMNESFMAKVQVILQQGIRSVWTEPTQAMRSILPTREELHAHSQACWDSLLLFLAGGEGEDLENYSSNRRSSGMLAMEIDAEGGDKALDLEMVLTRLKLLERGARGKGSNEDGDVEMVGDGKVQGRSTTREGFQFLLRPPAEQIWTIVDEFLQMQYDLNGEKGAAAVSFLLQLGFCEEGKTCELSSLSGESAKGDAMTSEVAFALAKLGLLYLFKNPESKAGDLWVLPTHLSKLLCQKQEEDVFGGEALGGGGGPASSSGGEEGIIVETNYRVYAYTTSPLKRAILELFCLEEYVLPNLYVGRLSRESCNAAFEAGIGAELIVDYLRRNAHPQTYRIRAKTPVVPETIADSVRLWEAETKRLAMTPCAFYDKFESKELYLESLGHAKERGKLLWSNDENMRLAVKLDHYNDMRTFIKEAKSRNA